MFEKNVVVTQYHKLFTPVFEITLISKKIYDMYFNPESVNNYCSTQGE